jgi:chorismate synthase
MSGNIFGKILTLTTFGESHGKAIGGILDGFPAGVEVDTDFVQNELNRRRPGQSAIVSGRNESDEVEILSGIQDRITLGTPISFLIRNNDVKPDDYSEIEKIYRPSHADFSWEFKYGNVAKSGGGRSSARETAARVAAGAITKILLKKFNVSISAYVNQIGNVSLEKDYTFLDLSKIEDSIVRCPDSAVSDKMIQEINSANKSGDTLGGIITCVIKNYPAGIGEPVFNKLHAELGNAMLGINAVKGFEIGSGFKAASMKGSEHNDQFIVKDGNVRTKTNRSGGIQGGISIGEDIYFRVAFKPVSTLMKDQNTVSRSGEDVVLKPKGRHDVTVVPRAVPIVEAMAALVLADQLLLSKISRIDIM